MLCPGNPDVTLRVGPKHKNSAAGNLYMPKRNHSSLSLRKDGKLCLEVARIYDSIANLIVSPIQCLIKKLNIIMGVHV